MSKTIHKYIVTPFTSMPKEAQILHIARQNGLLTLWAVVDPTNDYEERRFKIVGTGWAVCDNEKHIGTYFEGEFVWHVFEIVD